MTPDLFTRPGTMDAWIAEEVRGYMRFPHEEDDVVLDVGAHIGAYARLAAEEVTRVHAVEANPANHLILLKNVSHLPHVTTQLGAVTSRPEVSLPIYANTGVNTGSASTVALRGRAVVATVPTIQFDDLIKRIRPTIVKVDIEGGEYDLDWTALNDTVRAVIMELHYTRKRWRTEQAPALIATLMAQGFEALRFPHGLNNRSWTGVGIWRRST